MRRSQGRFAAHFHQPSIALAGATLMTASGILPLPEAVRSIDYETIILLFGMMVVVAYLRLSGAIDRLAELTLGHFRTPCGLLAVTIILSGALSHIPYWRFTSRLAPMAIIGLVIDYLVIAVVYRQKLGVAQRRRQLR